MDILQQKYNELRQEGVAPAEIAQIVTIYINGKSAGKTDAEIGADMTEYLKANCRETAQKCPQKKGEMRNA